MSDNSKETVLLLCADVLNAAEKKINERLNNEKNTGQTALGEEISKELNCDQFFAIQLISAYVKARPDIETTKGRNGGIHKINSEVKSKEITEETISLPKKEEVVEDVLKKYVAEPVKEVKIVLTNEEVLPNQTAEAHRKAWKEREDKEAQDILNERITAGKDD